MQNHPVLGEFLTDTDRELLRHLDEVVVTLADVDRFTIELVTVPTTTSPQGVQGESLPAQ